MSEQDNPLRTSLDLAAVEQAQSAVADLLPPFWHRLHRNTVTEGFTNSEALELLKTYILSQNPYGIRLS